MGSFCDQYIDSDGYIFALSGSRSQSDISRHLQFVKIAVDTADMLCREQISRVVCNYFYPSCGSREGIHHPLSLCTEECEFVSVSCNTTWQAVMKTLTTLENSLGAINCTASSSRFGGLSACCIGAGINITIPGITIISNEVIIVLEIEFLEFRARFALTLFNNYPFLPYNLSLPVTTVPSPLTPKPLEPTMSGLEALVAPLAGGIIAAIVLIVVVLVVIVICLIKSNSKRKKLVKEIQLEVLTK